MKLCGHKDRNILLLNEYAQDDLIEYTPILDGATGSDDNQWHDMPEEALPELIDNPKTVLIPVVQTMKQYILLHYQRGIAAELCRQIMDGEVATGYDIDDIQVVPLANTCRLRKMAFWRKSSSIIIADIDVGIDLFLKDGVIDDTVKASFRVALCIDMDEGEIIECNIYSDSDSLPERDMWLLSDYLVPILRKDEIEAGAAALLERYHPEALYDLKIHNAIDMAERMGLRVMTLPLYKRLKTKSILYFRSSEIAVCMNQQETSEEVPELVRIPGNTIVINTNVIPKDSCQLNIYHECIHFDWHYLFYRLQDMHSNDVNMLKTRRIIKTAKMRGENPLLWMEWQAQRGSFGLLMPASAMRPEIRAAMDETANRNWHLGRKMEYIARKIAYENDLPKYYEEEYGNYYSTPSTDTDYKYFDLSAIPPGSDVTAASLVAVIGSPWTGAEIRRVDGTTFYSPRDVTAKIQTLGGDFSSPVEFQFRFKANGDAGSTSFAGISHTSSQTYSSIQLIVTYDPPASTGSLTLSTVDIGQIIRLQNIVSQNGAYTHKVKWKLLGAGEQIQNLAAGVTYTDFTLPASWYSLLPSATSGTATCMLETYDGTTLLGSNTYSFTATVNASIIPTISSLAATPYSDTSPAVPAGWNLYVKNKSKAAISASIAPSTGASVQTVKVEGAGFTGWALPYTTGLLTTVGAFTFTVTVTDTRGRQKVLTVGITVTNYASPSASGVAFSRAATNGGAPDLNGTYIRGIATLAYTAIGTNTLTAKAYYRQMGTTTWYPAGGTTVVSATAYWMGSGGINVAYPYEVKLVLLDALTTIEIAGVIPTALRFWDFRADRAALGRFASNTKQFALPDDWDILHKGQTLDARYAKAADLSNYLPKAGGTMTGALECPVVYPNTPLDVDTVPESHPDGLTINNVSAYSPTVGYGTILTMKEGDYRVSQLLIDSNGKQMYMRGGRSAASSTGWNPWRRLHTDYTITEGSGTPSGGTDGDVYFKTS